jgi:hypothetical protein
LPFVGEAFAVKGEFAEKRASALLRLLDEREAPGLLAKGCHRKKI